jgi:NADH dehydrogenase [ubiquinone] 1 alpha subcomplex assembly factor 7
MRVANAEYYSNADPLGVAGDFITAPEISQMFGELIGMWLTDIWLRQNSPQNGHYVELGPGRGTLAADALRVMDRFGFVPSAHFVEASGLLRTKQTHAVPQAMFHDGIHTLPDAGPLFIVANEFFDALPVRQFVATHSGWREQVVTHVKDHTFSPMPGLHAMDAAVPDEFRNAPANSIYETSPEASDIVFGLMGRLAKQGGVMLIVDYGYAEPGLGSTLQAVKDHEFADPFENPGNHDLTAHVNFLEIANLGRMLNLQVLGPVGQGYWLKALGICQRTQALIDASPDRADELGAARDRLISDSEMGTLFKILAIAHADWPKPEGFDLA